MSWMTWVLFVGLLWIYPVSAGKCKDDENAKYLRCCMKQVKKQVVVVADNFNGFIRAQKHWNQTIGCIVFLQKNASRHQNYHRIWPKINTTTGDLIISHWHIRKKLHLYFLKGRCNGSYSDLGKDSCIFNHTTQGPCQIRCLDTSTICKQSSYANCVNKAQKNVYIINIASTDSNCNNCNNPVKKPEKEIPLNKEFTPNEEGTVDAAQAAGLMSEMVDLATSIDVSSAVLTVGEVTGILVRQTDPNDVDELSFGYGSPNDSISIIDEGVELSRSVTVPREAFEKAVSLNISVPFVAVLRFFNLASDEMNSTVLGNEVIAVEMGTVITNLTDNMHIHFRRVEYEGIPSCQSWNGEGSRPNWTDQGCLTIMDEDNITCSCSHMTFFAILLAPPNVTISSSDLKSLTIITQVGCGLSMFFLSVVLFMHFFLRRTKDSTTTRIFIQLVAALFLLNLTFLINNYVAKLKSSVGCKIMAALMSYFMLATFTWFAVQAFHLCLQMYTGGTITIRLYPLRVSIASWVLPSIVVIALLIAGKYGETVINSGSEDNVAMCWMTDNDVHYIVNIGYYVLVFLFTFTTFIIILSWLFRLKKTQNAETGMYGKSIVIILGLCCTLGISWGFAFFAYGVLLIPAFYIFTVLNSFQGFFLFIYYYNTSFSGEFIGGKGVSISSNSTLHTSTNSIENPFPNLPKNEKKPRNTSGN